jgi:type IV secretion system protein VirD4
MLSAPTRSGKGVGVVIPNLLNWPDSSWSLDIKGENYDITAGYRAAHGQAVYALGPSTKTRAATAGTR